MSSESNYLHAAFLALAAFAGWTVSDAFLKSARLAGVPHGEIMLICGLCSMITIFLSCWGRKKLNRLRPKKWAGLAALGVCQIVGFLCLVAALPLLPLANAYIIVFMAPMVVACMASIFLKEPLGWRRALAIIGGFIGVVIAVNPGHLSRNTDAILPYIFLVGNMVTSSLQMFLLRAAVEKDKTESASFYPRVALASAGLIFCILNGVPAMPVPVFFALCASGVLGGVGWVLLANAYKEANAAAVAPLQYSQVVFGSLLGLLIWGEFPDAYLFCGSLIIMASGIILVRNERRMSRVTARVD